MSVARFDVGAVLGRSFGRYRQLFGPILLTCFLFGWGPYAIGTGFATFGRSQSAYWITTFGNQLTLALTHLTVMSLVLAPDGSDSIFRAFRRGLRAFAVGLPVWLPVHGLGLIPLAMIAAHLGPPELAAFLYRYEGWVIFPLACAVVFSVGLLAPVIISKRRGFSAYPRALRLERGCRWSLVAIYLSFSLVAFLLRGVERVIAAHPTIGSVLLFLAYLFVPLLVQLVWTVFVAEAYRDAAAIAAGRSPEGLADVFV